METSVLDNYEYTGIAPSFGDLNPMQKEAVDYAGGPLLIVAGAGTGKTKTLTSRIAKLISSGVPASRILALTFTNKAAAEMRQRIEAIVPGHGHSVWMHTFHAFGVKILRRHAALSGLKPDFLIYDEDDQKKMVQMALAEMGRETEKNKAGLFINIISRAKDDLLDAQSYAIHAQTAGDEHRIFASRVYLRYQAMLAQAGAVDFGDLLLKTVELLRGKTDLKEYYQEYFRHVLVDEYQDTNHSQYVLTKTLAAKHRNVCVVGDPDQSIYAWRGADIRNILEFERDFGDAKVITLEQNYRSTANILNAADNVIKRNNNRKPKNLWTVKQRGEPVKVQEMPTEMDEARWTARVMQELVREEGRSFKDIAVFYRTNAQSRLFEEMMRRYQIPYRLIGNVRFYDRKEIKDALAYARLLVNFSDTVSLHRVLNVPGRGIGKTGQEKIMQYAAEKGVSFQDALFQERDIPGLTPACRRGIKEFLSVLDNLRQQIPSITASEAVERMLMQTGYWKSIEQETEKDPEAGARLGNLQELVNALKEFEERCARDGSAPGLTGYLEEIALVSGVDSYDSEQSAVTLMTVHLAKGLEFPVVFLTGLEEGLFPIGAGNTVEEEMEEERRLCYVGMTRAKEQLVMTYAATRKIFGKVYSNLASRFILESKVVAETAPRPGEESFQVVPPPSYSRERGMSKGQKVRHSSYGTGRIISRSGSGESAKVTIVFDRGGMQTFMLRYAPLEPV